MISQKTKTIFIGICVLVVTMVIPTIRVSAHAAEAQENDMGRSVLDSVRRYAETPAEGIITDVDFKDFGTNGGIFGELRRFYESINQWLAENIGISMSDVVQFTITMFTRLFNIVIETVSFIFDRLRVSGF